MFDEATGSQISVGQIKRAESPVPISPESRQVRRRKQRKGSIDLDGDDMLDLHGKLLDVYRRELDRQYENRAEQGIDADFYDNIQWTSQDVQTLTDRGQYPMVYNVLSTALNWVTGTEKRSRMDYKILPRRKEDSKPAERKTALMKYLSDVNRSPFGRSRAFEDSVKVGVGWMEAGVEDAAGGDPVYDRYESWRNMLWDSAATEADLDDARFISRSKWVDCDIAGAMFPDRKELIEESIDQASAYASGIEIDGDEAMDSRELAAQQDGMGHETSVNGSARPRVRVIELWFRKPTQTYKMVGGHFTGDLFDFSDAHIREVQSGSARVERKPVMRMYVALMTAKGFLWFGESPYRHNRYPFTPIWAYKRDRDGMPYGMIRGLRDIQMDINKRASKALHILSSNKVIMDEGAVEDINKLADEVARPDAIIAKKKGYELKIDADRELAAPHLELMSRSINMIQQQSGITDELMGRHTNATSGIAIQRRQDQGSTTTTNLFDNLRFAVQVHGEKQLSLIEQFYSEQKDFRITNMRGTPEYVTLNSGLPEDDITRSKADFIVSEADWHATLRQSAAEALLQAIQTLGPAAPQLVAGILDLVVENMDLPNRDEIMKRIRQATGQSDPDAEEPSPEQIAAQQEKQEQAALMKATAQAALEEKQANTAAKVSQAKHSDAATSLVLAQIKKLLADAQVQGVAAQNTAIDAALKLIGASGAAPVADTILREAGFDGREAQAVAGHHMPVQIVAKPSWTAMPGIGSHLPPPGGGAVQPALGQGSRPQ